MKLDPKTAAIISDMIALLLYWSDEINEKVRDKMTSANIQNAQIRMREYDQLASLLQDKYGIEVLKYSQTQGQL